LRGKVIFKFFLGIDNIENKYNKQEKKWFFHNQK